MASQRAYLADDAEAAPVSARYEQVKRFILDGIARGRWKEGDRLPSEPELAESLGISRMTIHRALRELAVDGVLVRRQGVGSFVGGAKPRTDLIYVNDIAADIRARGQAHSCKVLLLEAAKATPQVATALSMIPGADVFHSKIVHYADGVAVQLEERHVNPRLAPDYLKQDFTAATPHEYLMAATPVTEIEHVIHAVKPDRVLCRQLSIEASEPCLMVLRRTWSGQTVATNSRFIYPGSRYSLGSRYRTDRIRGPHIVPR
ncbi:MAG: histidine utilization repressor [Candidatus Eiseniibacteriota bacterium]